MTENKFIHIPVSWKTMFALINCLTMCIFPFYMITARVIHNFSSTSYQNNKIMFHSTQSYECHPVNDSYSVTAIIFLGYIWSVITQIKLFYIVLKKNYCPKP